MDKRLNYLEIPAADAQRAARFYGAVLGWKIEVRPGGDPRFQDDGAQLIGRWIIGRPSAKDSGIVPYFTVDSVAEAAARAPDHGGEVIDAPFREGDLLVSRLRDPEGNVIGIWQFAEAKV